MYKFHRSDGEKYLETKIPPPFLEDLPGLSPTHPATIQHNSAPVAHCRLIPADTQPRLIDLNSPLPPYPLTDINESDAPVTKRHTDVIL